MGGRELRGHYQALLQPCSEVRCWSSASEAGSPLSHPQIT